MRKITAIAGSLLSTTALVSGTAAVTSAHEGETTRTLHFADVGLRDTHVGTTAAVSSGVDKVHGKVIGYSAATGTFDAKSQQFRIQIAIALKGGIVVLAFSQGQQSSNRFQGRVATGTGRFHDAHGTFRALQTSEVRTVVTIRYTVGD